MVLARHPGTRRRLVILSGSEGPRPKLSRSYELLCVTRARTGEVPRRLSRLGMTDGTRLSDLIIAPVWSFHCSNTPRILRDLYAAAVTC